MEIRLIHVLNRAEGGQVLLEGGGVDVGAEGAGVQIPAPEETVFGRVVEGEGGSAL